VIAVLTITPESSENSNLTANTGTGKGKISNNEKTDVRVRKNHIVL